MKNKKINWPSTQTFTLKEVFTLNPTEKEITMRVRITKEKEAGKIAELGAITGNMGRPTKLYAFTPITPITIAKAEANRVNIVDGLKKAILG